MRGLQSILEGGGGSASLGVCLVGWGLPTVPLASSCQQQESPAPLSTF